MKLLIAGMANVMPEKIAAIVLIAHALEALLTAILGLACNAYQTVTAILMGVSGLPIEIISAQVILALILLIPVQTAHAHAEGIISLKQLPMATAQITRTMIVTGQKTVKILDAF